ncbi:hypothetical protein Tco_1157304 [Tanacetum coccineum]
MIQLNGASHSRGGDPFEPIQPNVFASMSNPMCGVDVNAVDLTGQTALHWSSAVRGAILVLEIIIVNAMGEKIKNFVI